MHIKKIYFAIILAITATAATAKDTNYEVTSPDGTLKASVSVGDKITWQISHGGIPVLLPSTIALDCDGTKAFVKPAVKKAVYKSVNEKISTSFYKKASVTDSYNSLTLKLAGGVDLQVRVYDEAAAYRFVTDGKTKLTVNNEVAEFVFDNDYDAFVPYVNDNRGGNRYCYSFESYYDETPISGMYADSLAITPMMVCLDGGKKAVVMDAGVMSYPGMYLKTHPDKVNALIAEFAPVPVETEIGGFNRLNLMPVRRADYIAKVEAGSTLPWRVVVITDNDSELIGSDISHQLSPRCRIADTSWIRPGKVAWDWWNTCNLTGVDFKAGMNTPTYKKYIDFAAANSLEYIIIDEGWSTDESMFENLNPDIDLHEIIEYGKTKGVGVILWAAWRNIKNDTERVCRTYADMGIKGFKVDFIDRDDQEAVSSLEKIAEIAAAHHLLLDYHGMKPNGLHCAYPNIVNYEGVKGLENAKWEPVDGNGPMHDFPRYDVTAPYLRMLVGPMDYTPGAMDNATRGDFRALNDHPMSMGTRVHQMAMYTLFDAPLQMLADSPSKYMREQQCTDFISQVPTTFDETVPMAGEIGEYVAVARRNGDIWYVAAMTDWTERDIEIDLSFLGDGYYTAEIFTDGKNADREATDYRRYSRTVSAGDRLSAHMMPGGGWTARISRRAITR